MLLPTAKYLHAYFPHLEQLALPDDWTFYPINLHFLNETLRQNRQIKHLSARDFLDRNIMEC